MKQNNSSPFVWIIIIGLVIFFMGKASGGETRFWSPSYDNITTEGDGADITIVNGNRNNVTVPNANDGKTIIDVNPIAKGVPYIFLVVVGGLVAVVVMLIRSANNSESVYSDDFH